MKVWRKKIFFKIRDLCCYPASELEKSGMKGRVSVIDGSAVMFRSIMDSQGISQSEEELQNYVLAYLVSVFYQNVERSKFKYLSEEKDWDGKCNKTLDLVLELGYQYSKDDLRHCFNACYNRGLIMANTNEGTLGYVNLSNCLFVRPTVPTYDCKNECYDMESYFKEKVEVVYVEGNHQTVVSNPELADILMKIHDKF